jgi:hypothetical protein
MHSAESNYKPAKRRPIGGRSALKVLKWLAISVAALFVLFLVIGLTRSDKDNFKSDARSLVEKQVGDDADVTSIEVYDHGNGDLTACGQVSYQPKLMGSMGLAGKINSPFFVQKNGVVLIGVGDVMGVVTDAMSNGRQLKAPSGADGGSNSSSE